MNLFIHTYGRVNDQQTLRAFSTELRKRTYLVVQEREADAWWRRGAPKDVHLLTLPSDIQTLSPTRQWILEYAKAQGMDKICMMDDDLRFSHRRKGQGTKLFKSNEKDVEAMFAALEKKLKKYVHAGISAREGNNHIEKDEIEITRMMRVLAYRPTEVLNLGCRFDRMRTKQDFDMTLQLLSAKKKNVVLFNYAQDQGGSQASGGCATYRTPEMMSEDAKNLQDLWPHYVRVVEKKTKGAWGGGTRLDVNIAWKKAFENGKRVINEKS